MPGHMTEDKRKFLLPPVSISRGITLKQKQNEDKALELEAWRKSKLKRTEPFVMKTFNNYFENQQRIQAGR